MMDIKEDFLKKSKGNVVNIPLEFNEHIAKELHKPNIRYLKRRKVYSGFKDNIWGADFTDMQLISKSNQGFRFSLCVILLF